MGYSQTFTVTSSALHWCCLLPTVFLSYSLFLTPSFHRTSDWFASLVPCLCLGRFAGPWLAVCMLFCTNGRYANLVLALSSPVKTKQKTGPRRSSGIFHREFLGIWRTIESGLPQHPTPSCFTWVPPMLAVSAACHWGARPNPPNVPSIPQGLQVSTRLTLRANLRILRAKPSRTTCQPFRSPTKPFGQ
jgi:hypothetical protein